MDPREGASSLEVSLFQKAMQTGTPVNGSLELVPFCNMDCDFCYVHLTPAQAGEAGGRIHSGKEWLKAAEQMREAGVLFLLITGGEPLLHPDFREIFSGLKKMGFILTLNTNGTLIDEGWIEYLKKEKPRRVNLTLYGAGPETYEKTCHYREGFDQSIRALHLLKKAGIDTRVGFSLGKENAQDAEAVLNIIRDLGMPVNFDPYMLPAVRERHLPFCQQSRLEPEEAARAFVRYLGSQCTPEILQQYAAAKLEEIRQTDVSRREEGTIKCLAGQCSFAINWQGEMRPCVILGEPSASIFTHPFAEAWETIREDCASIRLYSGCSVCRLRPVCRNCAACSLLESGSFLGRPAYMCRFAESLADALGKIAENRNTQDSVRPEDGKTV